MNFAVISGNSVTNIIVADSKEVAEEVTGSTCVEYTDANVARIGMLYKDGLFSFPTPVEPTE